MLSRFVTFAFAAADILIETDEEGTITFASGAVGALNVRDDLVGKPLVSLVEPAYRTILSLVVAHHVKGRRIGPVSLEFAGSPVQLSGWQLEDSHAIGWTISFSRAQERETPANVLDEEFGALVESRRASKEALTFTLLDVSRAADAVDKAFFSTLSELVRASALDGAGGLVGETLLLTTQKGMDETVEVDSAVAAICGQFGLGSGPIETITFEDDLTLTGEQVSEALRTVAERVNATGQMPDRVTLGEAAVAIARDRQKNLTALTTVIRNRRFEPYAQVIVDALTGEEVAYELLARLPGGKPFEAGVSMAEREGLVRDLDLAMFDFAMGFLNNGEERPPLAVNLSGRTLTDLGAMSQICKRVEAARFDRSRIWFEVTETARISDLSTAANLIANLTRLGCQVALDDFGEGASGVSYLQKLPVQQVKLETAFLDAAATSRRAYQIAAMQCKMLTTTGHSITMERVETEEQATLARRMGAARLQGWFFGKAMPLANLIEIHKVSAVRAGKVETFS
ncbi:hypothetical protein GCM10011367_15280 [Marinicauda pacifica]|uniref:EAL domain-containing protein n=1 Tax=Marinicauda pacifica TaxID=1133559 RepID=A0A4S2HAJ2_9PROT|nr:EAL domain-containing protein [Marinicauda pacifica]TGY92947.1 EAL domain-containing protein [Marinicauda pacifica]GGE41583.1 hypothetical protein GCM10011367_15280 [Marinicauda pacifica]